jgi:hypothetical protein
LYAAQAALVCTGAYKHTKTKNLMEEVGWASLKTRRGMQKACAMYKIQNNLAPDYLSNACPPLVGNITNYNLRNADNIALPMGRRTDYFNSFFPSTIRLWNKLDRTIKHRDSLDSFKYHMKKAKCRKKKKLYSRFNGTGAINHTRMRLGLSGLQSQRHDYNHVPRPTCNHCGARREDELHFFLQCRVFTPMRVTLLNDINAIYTTKGIHRDLTRTIVQKELVQCILNGDKRLSEGENTELFRVVQHFIISSRRF